MRRTDRARRLGVSVDELPDGRGRHSSHVKGSEHPNPVKGSEHPNPDQSYQQIADRLYPKSGATETVQWGPTHRSAPACLTTRGAAQNPLEVRAMPETTAVPRPPLGAV